MNMPRKKTLLIQAYNLGMHWTGFGYHENGLESVEILIISGLGCGFGWHSCSGGEMAVKRCEEGFGGMDKRQTRRMRF